MNQWQILEEGLHLASQLKASTLAQLIPGIDQAAQNVELFSLSNSGFYSSKINSVDNSGGEYGSVLFDAWYTREWLVDVVASAAWGIDDVVDPNTGETRFLEFAPSAYLYSYLSAAFTFYLSDDIYVSLSGYIQPLDATPLSAKFWQAVGWGTNPNNPNAKGWTILDPFDRYSTTSQCIGVKSSISPVTLSFGLDFSWPTCAFSLADFLSYETNYVSDSQQFSWASIKKRFDYAFTCYDQQYGFYHGNDKPLWSVEFGERLRQSYDIVPFVCNSNDQDTAAPSSDASATDPDSPTQPSDGQ